MRSFRLRLAIGIAVLDTALLLAGIFLETREHIHAGPSPHWLAFVELVIVLGYGPLAVLVVSRQPRNPVPWFLLFFATTAGAQLVLAYIAQRMLADGSGGRALARVGDRLDGEPRVRDALRAAAAALPRRQARVAALPAARALDGGRDRRSGRSSSR